MNVKEMREELIKYVKDNMKAFERIAMKNGTTDELNDIKYMLEKKPEEYFDEIIKGSSVEKKKQLAEAGVIALFKYDDEVERYKIYKDLAEGGILQYIDRRYNSDKVLDKRMSGGYKKYLFSVDPNIEETKINKKCEELFEEYEGIIRIDAHKRIFDECESFRINVWTVAVNNKITEINYHLNVWRIDLEEMQYINETIKVRMHPNLESLILGRVKREGLGIYKCKSARKQQ